MADDNEDERKPAAAATAASAAAAAAGENDDSDVEMEGECQSLWRLCSSIITRVVYVRLCSERFGMCRFHDVVKTMTLKCYND